MKPKAAG